MSKVKNIIAMIPAKLGSTRLPMKNLALLGGRPLIYYPIRAARMSGVFDKVVINAENAIFAEIAKRYRVGFYQRPLELVSPTTKTDTVVYCDIVAWASPIAPFQTSEEIREAVKYFIKEKLDSLMAVKNEQVHCIFKSKPVNFSLNKLFAQTQDLSPVQPFVYSLMMWRSKTFMQAFKEKGYALLCGKVGYFPVGKFSSTIVKKKEDLMLADFIMQAMGRYKRYQVKYDHITKKLRKTR